MGLRGNHIFSLVAAVFAAAVLFSCSRPDTFGTFVKSSHLDEEGMYTMTLDMSDSLAAYDFTLFTRLDCRRTKFAQLEDSFGVGVVWHAPDSTEYREFVYIPKDSFCASTPFSKSYYLPFRSGVVPTQPGEWTVSFLVLSDAAKYMNGMGIMCNINREEEE